MRGDAEAGNMRLTDFDELRDIVVMYRSKTKNIPSSLKRNH